MVDTLVLGTSAAMREGSSPFIRTKQIVQLLLGFLFGWISLEPNHMREGENSLGLFARKSSDGNWFANREVSGSQDATKSFHPHHYN